MIHLRRAEPGDVALLKYWDEKPHVIAATGNDCTAHDADDRFDWSFEIARDLPWRKFLIGEDEGRPVGVIQIIDPAEEETYYWGECEPDLKAIDIWIGEESDLGQGFGSQMMRLALKHCFSGPQVKAVLIDPMAWNVRAHRFYERHGFRFVERRMFGPDDCHVMRISRADWLGSSR